MKYMILTYGSQQDYDGMAGKASDQPAWTAEDFAAMGAFMETFNAELAESGELVETRALAAPVHTRRRPAAGRRAGGDRRSVRRDPGGARRLLDRGVRQLRPGDRDRRRGSPTARRRSTSGRPRTPTSGRSTSTPPTWRLSRSPMTDAHSRTCCAGWRRRSSARWSGATGTSTPPRTRCRRRCSPPPRSGRPRACRTTRGAG